MVAAAAPTTANTPIALRPYQREAVDAVYDHLRRRDDNPLVVIPTGGGKTPVMATVCRDAVRRWGGRVIVLAHVKELLDQTAATLRSMAPDLDIGVYSAGLRRRDTGNDVIVAGIQSVYKRACELDGFDLAIVDEAHTIPLDDSGGSGGGEGMYRTFLSDARAVSPHLRVIGLTATPYRMKDGLICRPDHFLNRVCYEAGVAQLIEGGYLSRLRSKAARSEVDTGGLHVRGGEFVSWEVEQLMDQTDRVRSACAEMVELTAERRSVLVFCVGVRHAEHVAQCVREVTGEACETITGDTPPLERSAILDRFKRAELKYLTNINVLTTGFDAPNIDAICLLRPTHSPGLYYQMVGRGFRLCEGKDDCLVLDFAGNIRRHGPVDDMKAARSRATSEGGSGEAPVKVCPACREAVRIAERICPACGEAFPVAAEAEAGSQPHEGRASTDAILSADRREPVDTRYEVRDVGYRVHVKRGAPEGHPRTLRVDYEIGWNDWQSEWVCVEHPANSYARQKAEAWWRRRTHEPVPTDADEAVALAEAGVLAAPAAITVRSTPGERFDRVVGYELDPLPPRLDGSDERCDAALPAYGPADDELPF